MPLINIPLSWDGVSVNISYYIILCVPLPPTLGICYVSHPPWGDAYLSPVPLPWEAYLLPPWRRGKVGRVAGG